MSKRHIIPFVAILLMGLVLLTIFYCDKQVEKAGQGKTFSDLKHVPNNHVVLLLGTGKYLAGKYLNPYYKYRIVAAVQLMKAGKVQYLVISGDNSRNDYNEPEMMRADLIAAGVDSIRIYLDFAGFRTFDSMIRLKRSFLRILSLLFRKNFIIREQSLLLKKKAL